MPTVLTHKGYRFFFYSNDHSPIHMHIEKGGKTAKYYLEPLELARSSGFNSQELREIRNFISENVESLKFKWNDFFDNN